MLKFGTGYLLGLVIAGYAIQYLTNSYYIQSLADLTFRFF